MATSSARPDLIDDSAARLRARARSLEEVSDIAVAAIRTYAANCADHPLSIHGPGQAIAVVEATRTTATHMVQVADAFRLADTTTARSVAFATDGALSTVIAATTVGLPPVLTAPTRNSNRQGRALGREMVEVARTRGVAAALGVVASHHPDADDPVLWAAVFNVVGPSRLQRWLEELTSHLAPSGPNYGSLEDLAGAWSVATRTLDSPTVGASISREFLDEMLDTPTGRNSLRLLAGASATASGSTYLRLVRTGLVIGPASADAEPSGVYRRLSGLGTGYDGDAAVFRALVLTPGAVVSLMADRRLGATYEDRARWVLDRVTGSRHLAPVALRQVLDQPDWRSGNPVPRGRADFRRGIYDWVAARPGADLGEPMGQLLADLIATDPDLYLARSDTSPNGIPTQVFTAVTRYRRPWLTALLALEAHTLRTVRESLHQPLEVRLTALDQIHRLADTLEAAAVITDQPLPPSTVMFDLTRFVSSQAVGAVTVGATPAVGTVVGLGVDRLISHWQTTSAPPAGTTTSDTRLHREALRRKVWLEVAADPELGRQLCWTVEPGRVGSRITSSADLLALEGTSADLDELAAWADAQPAHLRALVDSYLEPS